MNTSHSVLRVMSLHALAYCERLFYLEEVEEMRVADARVYAGRRLHVEIERDEEGEWHTLELESSMLGLRGKVDCLRKRDGVLIPYEHKRGRSARSGDGTPATWASDRLQIIAYAALVADYTGEIIPEARVRYHADNVTVRVPIDDEAMADLHAAIDRARELQGTIERPPVATNERLCAKCSLAPVCLPEEARMGEGGMRISDFGLKDEDAGKLPALPGKLRLFPADDDRASLHVMTQGASVGRSGDRLKVYAKDEPDQLRPVHEVGQVVLHGFSQITTQALRLCAENNVAVHWITTAGTHIGSWSAGAGSVQRRIRQYKALTDEAFCLSLAKRLVEARARGQLSFLLRASRDAGREEPELKDAILTMRKLFSPLQRAENIASLRGYEGSLGAQYFKALPHLVKPELGDAMRPDGRSRRPPRDRCNALLSYGYGLLLKDVTNAILITGLDPSLGFYHQPRTQAHPLALDLMEMFRVPLVDLPVIASINRRQWDEDEDFTISGPQVWLSEKGRKKFIGIYEQRKADKWKHPVIGYSLSYTRMLELEVRLLEKEWMNEGGLFAKWRLR